MDEKQQIVFALCQRMKEDTAAKVLRTIGALERSCQLNQRQCLATADLLTALAAELVNDTLDLAIEITQEETRFYER